MSSSQNNPRPACLGGSHGYAFDGDEVDLNAEIQVEDADISLALQLWASHAPHEGGELEGSCVAEIGLSQGAVGVRCVNITLPAALPAGTDEHTMVLVLKDSAGRVLDWSNYPRRETFQLPRLGGEVAYSFQETKVELTAGTIANPRAEGSLSGNLSLELWALAEPYAGGEFVGYGLAAADVGQVFGKSSLVGCLYESALTPPPDGTWHLVLMLREWTGLAYRTRDFTNFGLPVSFPLATGPTHEAHLPAHDSRPAGHEEHAAVQQCSGGTPEPSTPGKVSVNSSSLKALQEVKGLPKAVAAAIIAGRPWASLEDLLQVKGMGPKLLEKLKPLIGL